MEAIVAPIPSWDAFPEGFVELFQGFRSPAGEAMILEQNVFIEGVLPGGIMRKLNDSEMTEYRRPFLEAGEARRPTLTWPRQIPIAGEPAEVVDIVSKYSAWISKSDLPKLFVNTEPGAIIIGAARDYVRTWPNQTEITVSGIHFVQEDAPDEIGQAIADWLPA